MEVTEKINIRGAITSLETVGGDFVFPRTDDYKPSTVRSTAAQIKADTGRSFRVEVKRDKITVIRKS